MFDIYPDEICFIFQQPHDLLVSKNPNKAPTNVLAQGLLVIAQEPEEHPIK